MTGVETREVYDGDVVCRSGLFGVSDQRDDVCGRVMRRTDDGEYETVGRVDANVSRIEGV